MHRKAVRAPDKLCASINFGTFRPTTAYPFIKGGRLTMAIFHFRVDIKSRAKEQSAVASIAYISGEKIYSEWDGKAHGRNSQSDTLSSSAYISGEELHSEQHGKIHDYTRKRGIVHTEIMLPKHAKDEFKIRSVLWNSAENAEKQWNAQTARMIVAALPAELNHQEKIEVVREFVQKNLVDSGMYADFAIHDKGDGNPHVHIQLTMRPLNADGTWGAKSKKEYILDKNGNKIRLPSGEWKSRRVNTTDWDDKETLIKWRENWAKACNRALERKGLDERIDHRTLEAQGIDREPTIHVGYSEVKARQNEEIIRRNVEKGIRIFSENKQEIQRLEHRAKEMAVRVDEVRDQYGRDYFKHLYGVDVEQAGAEIARSKAQTVELRRELEQWEKWGLFERKQQLDLAVQRERGELREYERVRERTREFSRGR